MVRSEVWRLLDQLEARAAIHAGAFEPVGLAGDEYRAHRGIVVEVLHDDAVALQRQVDHVARGPRVANAIEHGVAAALQDVDHLPALELEPARAAARWDLLLE